MDILPHPYGFSSILRFLSNILFRSLLKRHFFQSFFYFRLFTFFSSYTAFARIVSSFMTLKPDVKL